VGVFSSPRAPAGQRENRALTFIQPLLGAHLQALTDQAAGDIDSSLRQQTVWACVHLIASVMSMMPPYAYRGGQGMQGYGDANRLPDQPVLLNQPSARWDIMDFVYQGMMSLLLRGNMYGLIADRDAAGRATQIELQHPDQVHVKQHEDGTVEYKVRNRPVPPQEMWHKAAFLIPGKVVGLSPLQYMAQTVRLSENARSFGSRYFEDGGHPSGLITNENPGPKGISQDDAQTIKQRFMAAIRGSREPVVMGGGWKYQAIQIKPDESQFLNTQKWTGNDICKGYGVPPEMVGSASEGSAITYANVENRMLDFLVRTMLFWVIRWERWLGNELPGRQYVKFDDRALLKTDFLSRLRGYHLMSASHAFAPDEIREFEDMPPLTAAQVAQILELNPGLVQPESQTAV
jgi:HK97 family phage portal protein